jgi:hypothetical protein
LSAKIIFLSYPLAVVFQSMCYGMSEVQEDNGDLTASSSIDRIHDAVADALDADSNSGQSLEVLIDD